MSTPSAVRNLHSTPISLRLDKSLVDRLDKFCTEHFVTKTQAITYLIHNLTTNPKLHPNLGLPIKPARRPRKRDGVQQTIDAGSPT
jgi:hypothetical protein